MTRRNWAYIAGEKGRNRVRAFEKAPAGKLYLEYQQDGRRLTKALGTRDRGEAKMAADRAAAEFGAPRKVVEPDELTVGELFDNYMQEIAPGKSKGKVTNDRRMIRLWLTVVHHSRQVVSLTEVDARHFIEARKASGDLRPGRGGRPLGKAVRPRSWRADLKFLKARIRQAATSGLITRHPGILGFKDRSKAEVRRPLISDREVEALLGVADEVSLECRCMLTLAHDTGHRIGAIRQLRWNDIDFGMAEIHWRAELDKIGNDHRTPIPQSSVDALWQLRDTAAAIGEAHVFPSPRNEGTPVSENLVRDWWQKLERLAGIARIEGRGWHSIRRKFATDLKGSPIVDVASLGGWKDTSTIQRSYQHSDSDTMRHIVDNRKSVFSPTTAEGTAES